MIALTRKVGFSSGHRYWRTDLTAEQNKTFFGPWASPYNHGHNYTLYVTIEGPLDPQTGMVVNIKTLDDILKSEIVSKFDGRSINDEIPAFVDRSPSLENLLLYFFETLTGNAYHSSASGQVSGLPSGISLTKMRLDEMDSFYATLEPRNSLMTLTRSYEFAASHRLHLMHLSDAENIELFGKCNNPNGHGHNYVVEVSVDGEVNPETGMMVDLMQLDEIVNEQVVDRYDHKNLNEDLPEFKGKPTTSEAVAQEIFGRLQAILGERLESVRLLETARSVFEVRRSA